MDVITETWNDEQTKKNTTAFTNKTQKSEKNPQMLAVMLLLMLAVNDNRQRAEEHGQFGT